MAFESKPEGFVAPLPEKGQWIGTYGDVEHAARNFSMENKCKTISVKKIGDTGESDEFAFFPEREAVELIQSGEGVRHRRDGGRKDYERVESFG